MSVITHELCVGTGLRGFVIAGSGFRSSRRTYSAVGVRAYFAGGAYPKAPSYRNLKLETPPRDVVLKPPVEAVLEVDTPRVEPAHATAEASLPIIHFFQPSLSSAESFANAYNGKGLDRIALKMMGATLSTADAQDVLSRAVEGALIATFQYAMTGDELRVTLRPTHGPVLKQALKKRIPKLSSEHRESLAENLLCQLKDELAMGRRLAVDGALISVERGSFVADIHTENLAEESDESYSLAA